MYTYKCYIIFCEAFIFLPENWDSSLVTRKLLTSSTNASSLRAHSRFQCTFRVLQHCYL